MSALILISKDTDGVTVIPFAYRSGELNAITQELCEYMWASGMADSVWENIAGDRLATILAQNMKIHAMQVLIDELKAQLDELREWAAFTKSPLAEVAG